MGFTKQEFKIIASTKRLNIREFQADIDAQSAFELNNDPDVLRYTGDLAFTSVDEARKFLLNYQDYLQNGMGRWALTLKNDHTFIGWCGLKKHSDGMIDLGYRLLKDYWGKGYATEASIACLHYGFNTLGLTEIIGRVARENPASIKVLEKCGFSYWKTDTCEGIEDSIYYKLNKADFIH